MLRTNYKIGVFDSGVGGLSVAKAIQKLLPDSQVVFKNDSDNVPYGNKKPSEILQLITPIFQELEGLGCDVIVVACNTVSTTLITELRKMFAIPMVAMEPMVKPAAQLSTSKVIAVCATPATLASPRYKLLKQQYAKSVTVLEPDCSDWSTLIEHNKINDNHLQQVIEPLISAGADVIALGCTHYHWIEKEIIRLSKNRAIVLQPELAVLSQLKRVLARLP